MDAIEQPKSLTEQTHDILLNAICSGEFEPGERLNQDDIAARLKVSRQPVNSAISVLKANGFVEDTGRRGVVVSQISVDHFLSIYEFRSAVEPFAVRLAHERKPPDAAQQAQAMLKRGWDAVKSRDARTQIEVDFEFHTMIYRWSGNSTILESMRTNWHHIRRSMGVVLRQGVASSTSWEEHEKVIDALMRDDVETAARDMKAHIENAQCKTLTLLSQS
ncbi:GntR family transcriptional regulator [Marivita hallyeonensis]|uniref:Transcriptional regulator, GntR family n=1 Tax=Marivita hallyeonensis TaxID=996342 RepID=A0A1M5LPU1_9RHOB|nr:GntR family transcriptional regulator [Marivita hallyeonensis]SHG66920.1 transcriptional regulator, GntR family [Marivita hallyeonensis]